MKRILVLLTLLSMAGAASAATIANWRFEEGAGTGHHDGFYLDTSGNLNHLSAWTNTQNPVVAAEVPFTSQGGVTNTVALDFDGWANKDNIGTWGTGDIHDKMLDTLSFTNGWTIEGTFNTREWNWGDIVTKNGKPFDLFEPTLRTQVNAVNHTFAFGFIDGSTNWVQIESIDPVHLDRWYSFAGTYDTNGTFSLYLKQQDGGDYVLQGTMTNVFGATLNYDTNFWKIASGTANGNPEAEFFNGMIDEVKISDTALSMGEFINQDGFTVPFNLEKPHSIMQGYFEDLDVPFNLSASDYWSPVGYAFTSSVWQISTDNTFVSVDWAGTTGAVETITVPANALLDGNTYYARVQYLTDSGASAWSDAQQLTLIPIKTVAYWRFEELGDGQRHDGDQDDFYQDASGNGNHLSSWWTPSRPSYVDDVPATLALAQANNTAIDFYRFSDIASFTGVGATGPKMLNNYAFTNGWTVECSFNMRSLNEWYWEQVVGKQGARKDVFPGIGGDMPPFTMKVFSDPNSADYNKMIVEVIDDDGNEIWIWSNAALELNKWYSYAVTYNGDALELYIKTQGDDEYVLQSTVPVSAGISFSGWNTPWSVGRGYWNVGADGFMDGTVDEVRISDGALPPSKFIHQTDEFGGYDVKMPNNVNLVNFTDWNAPIRVSASAFYSPRGYSHTASQWQVSTDAGFASVSWDSGAINGSNFVDIPAGSLASASYYVRVGYQANGTWAWSDAYSMDITTIAHWRFEEGPNGGAQASAADSSFYGNSLTQSDVAYQPTATNDVSFSTVPQTWEANDLAISCTGGDRGMTSAGAGLNTYAFVNGWTVECTFKFDAIWWQIIMSKTGHRNGTDWEMPFWFKALDSNKHLQVLYTRHESPAFDGFGVAETLAPIEVGKWYSVAAVFDNETIKLYLKGEGDSEYVLQRAYNENYPSALAFVADYSAEWMVGAGTGVWDGNPATEAPIDFFNGMVDEIKISNVALQPGGFIADIGAGWDSDNDGMADSWEILYFGSIEACDPEDDTADNDGRNNLSEFRQGGSPIVADLAHPVLTGTVDLGGGTNAFEYAYPRRKYPYNPDVVYRLETTDDLISPDWVTDDSVVVSGVGFIDAEFDAVTNQVPMDTDEKFIKLIIE